MTKVKSHYFIEIVEFDNNHAIKIMVRFFDVFQEIAYEKVMSLLLAFQPVPDLRKEHMYVYSKNHQKSYSFSQLQNSFSNYFQHSLFCIRSNY